MTTPTALLATLGRLLIAVIFLISGFGKLTAPGATLQYIASAGLPLPMLGYVIAIAVEFGCGILLVLGYKTRLVATLMALFSVATALSFHHDFADQNQTINFLKNISMAGGLLQVVAFGGGPLSVDRR